MWENIKSLMEAAEQGDAKAQTELADRYRDGKGIDQDYTKAVEWYRKAAEQNYDYAIEALERLDAD